jgi:hypothetical protein
LTRCLGTDREDPQCGTRAGRPVPPQWADGVPGRLWPRPGPRRQDAEARARAVRVGPSANGGRRTRRKAGGGIGCRCRSSTAGRCLAVVVVPVLYRVPPGRLPAGKPGPAGGALMSGAMAGRNTPAGGGPVGAALRARSCGRRQSCRPRDRAARAEVRLPEPPAAGQARLTGSPAVVVRAVTRRAWRA